MWYTKNLRCASCMGACAVCNAACCMYEAGCRAKKDPKSGTFKAAQAERIVSNIEALGSHVRDNPTFIMCTLGGGCGRYICPECCGTCLNEACRDVQCKVCTMHDFPVIIPWLLSWIGLTVQRIASPIPGDPATGMTKPSHMCLVRQFDDRGNRI